MGNKRVPDMFPAPGTNKTSVLTADLSPLTVSLKMREDLDTADTARLQRYYTNWKRFLGQHWDGGEPADGIKRLTFNYTKAFLNKMNRFMNNKGFAVIMPDKYKDLGRQLNKIWELNSVNSIAKQLGQSGCVTGDMWIRVNYVKKGNKKEITFSVLDASTVFPLFNAKLELTVVEIRHPSMDDQGQLTYANYISEIHDKDKGTVTFVNKQKNGYVDEDSLKHLNYTVPIGELLVIHGANYEVASSFWGIDDIEDIAPLNIELNEVYSKFREIIDYQEEPITIVKGAKMKNVDKSARKMWSGIPKDGDVYNLTLDTDLPATQAYLDKVLQAMHDITGVPEQTLGRLQNISNTSGIALHYQNLPLMEVRQDKIDSYSKMYKQVNIVIIKLLDWMDIIAQPVPKKMLESNFMVPTVDEPNPIQDMTIDFPNPLPRDTVLLLNEIRAMFEMELISEEKADRMLGIKPEERAKMKSEIKDNQPVENGGFITNAKQQERVSGDGARTSGNLGSINNGEKLEQEINTATKE